MEISVRQIDTKARYVRALLNNNIILMSHLAKFDKSRLARKTKLTLDECEDILNAIKPKRPHYVMKASEILIRPFDRVRTLIPELDDLLGGGIKCGQITEISGESAAGKSNICAQMGIVVMLPQAKKGYDGDVLFIHTEGEGKLKLAIKRFQTLAESIDQASLIATKLHVMNCCNEFELVEIVNRLPETLKERPSVKLIIIDSITCAFISFDENPDYRFYAKRSLRLTRIVKKLFQIAWDKRIAVVATNHVSFNRKHGETRPAMGKLWSHMCQTKIYLERRDTSRIAYVTKGAMTSPEAVHWNIQGSLGLSCF